MAQVKLLKINSLGLHQENESADDITFATVTGATSVGVTGGVTIDSNITFNAPTDTIAGIQNQNLLDKTAAETISAEYTIATGNNLVLTDAPTLATHATNKDYVDSVALNNKRKDSVLVATTGNITLSGEQTIDGVLTSSSRVLVWQQTNPVENGIYVSAAGAWVRSADTDTGSEILGALTKVLQGTTYNDVNFQNTNDTAPNIGVDNITFADLGSATSHNNLSGLQGGDGSNEFYHMTASEDTWLAAATAKVTAGGDIVGNNVDDTITANWTVTGEVDVAGGDFVLPNSTQAVPEEGSIYWNGTTDQLFVYNGSAYVDVSSSGTASNVENAYTVGGTPVVAGQPLYITSNDTVAPADASAIATAKVIGFAKTSEPAAGTVQVQEDGIIGALSAATANDIYYLSETPGAVTTSPPTTPGSVVYKLGFAKNATDLHAQLQFITIRS